MALKGTADAGERVPEANDEPVLRRAISAINSRSTAFFTVGCEKAFNREETGECWAKGYLEFAYNYAELVVDARDAFKLFFQFSHAVDRNGFALPVLFHWELEGAAFLDVQCEGFTICVWIQTADFETKPEAVACWSAALEFLTAFLVNVPQHSGRVLYG